MFSTQMWPMNYPKLKSSIRWYILIFSYRWGWLKQMIWFVYWIASLLVEAIWICVWRNWSICLFISSCWSYSPRWWWWYILTIRSLNSMIICILNLKWHLFGFMKFKNFSSNYEKVFYWFRKSYTYFRYSMCSTIFFVPSIGDLEK